MNTKQISTIYKIQHENEYILTERNNFDDLDSLVNYHKTIIEPIKYLFSKSFYFGRYKSESIMSQINDLKYISSYFSKLYTIDEDLKMNILTYLEGPMIELIKLLPADILNKITNQM